MVFKDILVNYSKSSKERLAFVCEHLKKLEKDEKVIFIGDTFYTHDLNLSYFVEFINLLNQYSNKIYIQDVETLAAKITNSQVKSWYTLPLWPAHITLYLTLEDIKVEVEELKEPFVFIDENTSSNSFVESKQDLSFDIKEEISLQNRLYLEHQEDLIGAFIEEVNELSYTEEKKVLVTKIGLDALLRR